VVVTEVRSTFVLKVNVFTSALTTTVDNPATPEMLRSSTLPVIVTDSRSVFAEVSTTSIKAEV
jgi:hypothetical protein